MPRKRPARVRNQAPATREGAPVQGGQAQPRSGQAGPSSQSRIGGRGLFNARAVAARPRIAALIIATIGYVLTEVNRLTVRNERNFFPLLMLFGPACVLFGIAGAIDPRIMNQANIKMPRTQMLFRAIMVAVVLAGMAIGWVMAHFWYKIW